MPIRKAFISRSFFVWEDNWSPCQRIIALASFYLSPFGYRSMRTKALVKNESSFLNTLRTLRFSNLLGLRAKNLDEILFPIKTQGVFMDHKTSVVLLVIKSPKTIRPIKRRNVLWTINRFADLSVVFEVIRNDASFLTSAENLGEARGVLADSLPYREFLKSAAQIFHHVRITFG